MIQQVGTPQDVFDHPYNLFVAGFIGTPQMNFIEAELERKSADDYEVSLDGKEVELSESKVANLAKAGVSSQKVILGVRPEHVMAIPMGESRGFTGKVELTELMGSALHIHLSAFGRDMIVVAQTRDLQKAGYGMIEAGEEIRFTFDGTVCHVFAKDTGLNLEHIEKQS